MFVDTQSIYYIIVSFTALIALVFSLITIITNRQSLATSTITKNRVLWNDTIRNLIWEFLSEYMSDDNKTKLSQISAHIMLYFDKCNPAYTEIVGAISLCLYEPYTKENCLNLINASQNLLIAVWRRMKCEAGIKSQPSGFNLSVLIADGKCREQQFSNVI